MGTRRIRDLHGQVFSGEMVEVCLHEERNDRRETVADRFGIGAYGDLEEAMSWEPDALVISTPPAAHLDFVRLAVERGLPYFCEAEIWQLPADLRASIAQSGQVAASSATLMFHPLFGYAREVIEEALGRLHAFGYLLSVDAPSWHPGEGNEYYARHRATAPAREMTAFELIALQYLVGHAARVTATVTQQGELGIDAEDTYCLQYSTTGGTTGQLSVLMACPDLARGGWFAGSDGILMCDLLKGITSLSTGQGSGSEVRDFGALPSVLEAVYATEIGAFVAAIHDEADWPFSIDDSARVCGTLAAAETSALTGRSEPVDPDRSPAPFPDAR